MKGSARVIYIDREEVFDAGNVFYSEPMLSAKIEAGTGFVMFCREEAVSEAAEVFERNLSAMQRGR